MGHNSVVQDLETPLSLYILLGLLLLTAIVLPVYFWGASCLRSIVFKDRKAVAKHMNKVAKAKKQDDEDLAALLAKYQQSKSC